MDLKWVKAENIILCINFFFCAYVQAYATEIFRPEYQALALSSVTCTIYLHSTHNYKF